jgi:hypothetical protein
MAGWKRNVVVTYLRRHHVALLALFLALGGTSYAAFKLPRNSVGTAQLKKGAVIASKVKAHSLLASDFRSGQLPAGPRGSQGPQGAPGAPGQPGAAVRAYAEVSSGASPSFRSGSGFTKVTTPSAGVYCLTPAAGITPGSSTAVVSAVYASALTTTPQFVFRGEDGACSSGQFEVETFINASMTPTYNVSFDIAVP